MNQHLKQRLIGATVLIVLGIIFLPMILDKPVTLETEPDVTNIELTTDKERQATHPDLLIQKDQPIQSIPPEVIARYEAPESKQKQQDPQVSKDEIKTVVETKSVSKVKESAKTEGSPQWAVQLGSFASKENADRLVQRLKLQKLPAYFEDLNSTGKRIYRVRVGPFDSKQKTEKMKQKLDLQEKLKTLIVTVH